MGAIRDYRESFEDYVYPSLEALIRMAERNSEVRIASEYSIVKDHIYCETIFDTIQYEWY